MNYTEYHIAGISRWAKDPRLSVVICEVRDENNPSVIQTVDLRVDLTGLSGTDRYAAVRAALIEVLMTPDVEDMKDDPDEWFPV